MQNLLECANHYHPRKVVRINVTSPDLRPKIAVCKGSYIVVEPGLLFPLMGGKGRGRGGGGGRVGGVMTCSFW